MPRRQDLSSQSTRVCVDCGVTKLIADFFPKGKRTDGTLGLNTRCKLCVRKASHAYYHENKAAVAKQSKEYRERNKERLRESKREYLHRESTQSRMRNAHLQKKYGITLVDYARLLQKQNGLCAICKRPEDRRQWGKLKPLAVDHDHATGIVRGLLCHLCNSGIGNFIDDRTRLENARLYLRGPNYTYVCRA